MYVYVVSLCLFLCTYTNHCVALKPAQTLSVPKQNQKSRESKSREKVLTKLKSKHKPQVPPPCLVLRFLKSNITS